MPPKRSSHRPRTAREKKERVLETTTIRAQDVLDRLIHTLDTEHQRTFLRKQWRENPTPAERAYLALGLDKRGPVPEFMLDGRHVSAEFAAGYRFGFEASHAARFPAPPLTKPIMGYSLMENAWAIIANAGGGDWNKETAEWRDVAARWRDLYHGSFTGPEPQAAVVERMFQKDTAKPIRHVDPRTGAETAGPPRTAEEARLSRHVTINEMREKIHPCAEAVGINANGEKILLGPPAPPVERDPTSRYSDVCGPVRPSRSFSLVVRGEDGRPVDKKVTSRQRRSWLWRALFG